MGDPADFSGKTGHVIRARVTPLLKPVGYTGKLKACATLGSLDGRLDDSQVAFVSVEHSARAHRQRCVVTDVAKGQAGDNGDVEGGEPFRKHVVERLAILVALP